MALWVNRKRKNEKQNTKNGIVTETLAQIAYFVIHLLLRGRSWGVSRSSVIRVRCFISLRSTWCSFFLFFTVFPQPFTGQMDTPSPHSIEWDGIKNLWEEKEPSQASCVLILIDTVHNYTMLVDSWIIICCITTKQPGYSEVSDMVSSLVELWTHFKYTLSWRRLKYCIYMVFSWGK